MPRSSKLEPKSFQIEKDKKYRREFLDKGLYPAEDVLILTQRQRVLCISEEGYKKYKNLNNIRSGSGSSGNKTEWFNTKEFEEYNKSIFLKNNGCILIESHGNGIDAPVTYIARCGHKNTCGFKNLYRRGLFDLCKRCSIENRAMRKRISQEELIEACNRKGCTFIERVTDGRNTKVRYVARCGHERVSYAREFIREDGQDYCVECSKSGSLNVTVVSRDCDKFKKIDKMLYIVSFSNKNCDEFFYKIGITGHSVKYRFSTERIHSNYNIETILEIKTNAYFAVLLEHILHSYHNESKYIPSYIFAGYTECFSDVDFDFIELAKNRITGGESYG